MTQAFPSERWAQYDERVEAMLDIGAAWVVETLLRTTARMPAPERLWCHVGDPGMLLSQR